MSAGKVAAGELRANPGICGGLCKCDVQAGRERDVGGHGANSRKVLYTATSYRKYIRALTFENLCQLGFVPLMSNVKTQTVLEPPLVGAEYARKLPAVIYSHGMLANRSCYSTPCINFFFLAICFFSTPHFAPTFFCPPCAVQACMLSCICTYTCIFFFIYCILFFCIFFFFAPDALCKYVCYHVYVHIHVYSYIYTYTYIHI